VAGRSPRRHRKPHPQQAKSQELKNAQEIDAGNRTSRKSNSPGGAPGGKHSTARLENEMRSKPDDFFFILVFLIIILEMNLVKRFFSNLALLSHANPPDATYQGVMPVHLT
jgi:hypothetical protein